MPIKIQVFVGMYICIFGNNSICSTFSKIILFERKSLCPFTRVL